MRRLLFALVVLCLPMLACVIPADLAENFVESDLRGSFHFDIAEDASTSLTITMDVVEEEHEEGEFYLSCTDLFADALPGLTVREWTEDGREICVLTFSYGSPIALQGMLQDEEGLIARSLRCFAVQDGVVYLDFTTDGIAAAWESEGEGPLVPYPLPLPFELTFAGPVLTTNGQVDGSIVSWDLASAPSHLLINLEEGQPCPGKGVTLVLRADEEGGLLFVMEVGLPPAADSAAADSIAQRWSADGWQVSSSGDAESGIVLAAVKELLPGHVQMMEAIGQVPGLGSSSSDLVVDVAYSGEAPERYEMEVSLDMSLYADWWLNLLPDAPTPPLTLLLAPFGTLQEATGDWASTDVPLVIAWDPASSLNTLEARAVSLAVAPAEGGAPAEESVPVEEAAPLEEAAPAEAAAPTDEAASAEEAASTEGSESSEAAPPVESAAPAEDTSEPEDGFWNAGGSIPDLTVTSADSEWGPDSFSDSHLREFVALTGLTERDYNEAMNDAARYMESLPDLRANLPPAQADALEAAILKSVFFSEFNEEGKPLMPFTEAGRQVVSRLLGIVLENDSHLGVLLMTVDMMIERDLGRLRLQQQENGQ